MLPELPADTFVWWSTMIIVTILMIWKNKGDWNE